MSGARSERWRTLAFLVLLIAVAIGVYILLARPPAAPSGDVLLQGGALDPSGLLKVYVSGEVLRPGVYDMQPGQRVEEALALAGGPTSRADLNDLNLAAKVKDELHLRVPAAKSTPVTARTPTPSSGALNVNTATQAELEALPGIGPSYARRILDSRPYHNVSDLEPVLGKSLYERVRSLVSAD